jgi:hypothetical protein
VNLVSLAQNLSRDLGRFGNKALHLLSAALYIEQLIYLFKLETTTMHSITTFAILLTYFLGLTYAAFTKENIVGVWFGTCKQPIATHPNGSYVCLPNNAIIDANYTITYSADKISFTLFPATITLGGTTYVLPEESQSNNPWSPSSQSGFVQTTYTSGDESCYFVNVDGNTMTEFGEYTVSDYSPLDQCPTRTQSISCGTTFTYECTLTRQNSAAASYFPLLGALVVVVFSLINIKF